MAVEPIPFTPVRVTQEPEHGPEQASLWDGANAEPVPFMLTARARLAVAPQELPDLNVVSTRAPSAPVAPSDPVEVQTTSVDTGDPDGVTDAGDTRAARARALRRGGTDAEAIARELGVGAEQIAAWVGQVEPVRTANGYPTRSATEVPVAHRTARAAARRRAATGVAPQLGFGAALAVAEPTAFAVTLRFGGLGLAVTALAALRDHMEVPVSRVRVQLRVPAGSPRDVTAHQAASRLGVAREQVTAVLSRNPNEADVQVRIADPRVAGTIAGWLDHLEATDSTEELLPAVG